MRAAEQKHIGQSVYSTLRQSVLIVDILTSVVCNDSD